MLGERLRQRRHRRVCAAADRDARAANGTQAHWLAVLLPLLRAPTAAMSRTDRRGVDADGRVAVAVAAVVVVVVRAAPGHGGGTAATTATRRKRTMWCRAGPMPAWRLRTGAAGGSGPRARRRCGLCADERMSRYGAVVCCLLCVVWCLVFVVWLFVVCCLLYVVCCLLCAVVLTVCAQSVRDLKLPRVCRDVKLLSLGHMTRDTYREPRTRPALLPNGKLGPGYYYYPVGYKIQRRLPASNVDVVRAALRCVCCVFNLLQITFVVCFCSRLAVV